MTAVLKALGATSLLTLAAGWSGVFSPAAGAGRVAQEGGDWYLDISRPGAPVRIAIPDFTAAGGPGRADETADAGGLAATAASISDVVRDDITYAGVYRMVPQRFHAIAQAGSPVDGFDYYQWESVGADILVEGTVRPPEGNDGSRGGLVVEVRLHAVRAQENVFARRYTAPPDAARLLAHRISDDILLQAGGYLGVAQTRIAFATTRNAPRSKEIYLMDYDGHGQRPVTANGSLNITPSWSPDGRAISYISYREGAPALYLAFLYQGRARNSSGTTSPSPRRGPPTAAGSPSPRTATGSRRYISPRRTGASCAG